MIETQIFSVEGTSDVFNIPLSEEPLKGKLDMQGVERPSHTDVAKRKSPASKFGIWVPNFRPTASTYVKNLVDSDIEYQGVMWQIGPLSRERINDIFRIATLKGSPDTESRVWILADDTSRVTTLAELKELFIAYGDRLDDIMTQYNAWNDGTMDYEFVYVPTVK